MGVGQLARLEEVEVLELAHARPEVEEVDHRPDGGMVRGPNHRQRRRQGGQVSRGARELDHRGEVEPGGDLRHLADGGRRGVEVGGGDRPVRHRRRVDELEAEARELLATFPPGVERGLAGRPRNPQVGQGHRGRDRRQPVVGQHASRRRQRVVGEEVDQHPVVELDVADARPRPALQRAAVAGGARGVLVHGQQHLAGLGGLSSGQPGEGDGEGCEQKGASRQHGFLSCRRRPSPAACSPVAPAAANGGRPTAPSMASSRDRRLGQ